MGVSQAHADVRDYLLDEVRSLGLEPLVQKPLDYAWYITDG